MNPKRNPTEIRCSFGFRTAGWLISFLADFGTQQRQAG